MSRGPRPSRRRVRGDCAGAGRGVPDSRHGNGRDERARELPGDREREEGPGHPGRVRAQQPERSVRRLSGRHTDGTSRRSKKPRVAGQPGTHRGPAGGSRGVVRTRVGIGRIGERFTTDAAATRPMRPRDDPTNDDRHPTEQRPPNTRERTRSHRGTERARAGPASRGVSSPLLVPGVTLAACGVVSTLAAVRSVGWLHREWTLAIAASLAAAGAVLGAVAAAHVIASVASGRVAGR